MPGKILVMQHCLPARCWLGVGQQLPARLQDTESVPGAEGAKRTATQPDRNAKRMKPLASLSEGLTEEDEVGPLFCSGRVHSSNVLITKLPFVCRPSWSSTCGSKLGSVLRFVAERLSNYGIIIILLPVALWCQCAVGSPGLC